MTKDKNKLHPDHPVSVAHMHKGFDKAVALRRAEEKANILESSRLSSDVRAAVVAMRMGRDI